MVSEPQVPIGLTLGDPAGIGPEITVKALLDEELRDQMSPIVIGSGKVIDMVLDDLGADLEYVTVDSVTDLHRSSPDIQLLDNGPKLETIPVGEVDAACGAAAADYIEQGVELAKSGLVDALVTGPINKQALRASGSSYPGHTEMLAELFEVPVADVLTMFTVERLRIFFLTRHHSLRDAIDLLDEELVAHGLVRANELMEDLGFSAPRISVAGLNPHCGDNGLMGMEDLEIVEPGIAAARSRGVDAVGPIPADSAFWQGREGTVDAVLALYHDQGHIAAKTVDFFGTVSTTLGLPVIRTAAEHGTGFDIAGKGQAEAAGEKAAIREAVDLIRMKGAEAS